MQFAVRVASFSSVCSFSCPVCTLAFSSGSHSFFCHGSWVIGSCVPLFFMRRVKLTLCLRFLCIIFPSYLSFFNTLPFLCRFTRMINTCRRFRRKARRIIIRIRVPMDICRMARIGATFPSFLITRITRIRTITGLTRLKQVLNSKGATQNRTMTMTHRIKVPMSLRKRINSSSRASQDNLRVTNQKMRVSKLRIQRVKKQKGQRLM